MVRAIYSIRIDTCFNRSILFSACSEQQQDEAKFLIEQAKEKTKEKGDGGD